MKIMPPRSTSRRTFLLSASVNRKGRWPVRYTNGYSRTRSEDSGTITPAGAVVISVYRATESMRFAGSVGALSQSPDSYRPVQKTNSLIGLPTMPEGPMHLTDLPRAHAALAATAV